MSGHVVIDPAAAEAVLASTQPAASLPAEPDGPTSLESAPPADDGEENIYEVMKEHMRRKQAEKDAAYAAQKAQQRGRPGPTKPTAPLQPIVRKADDLTDLEDVWATVREYYQATNAHIFESVIGPVTRIRSLTAHPPEVVLEIPRNQQGFANDKGKAKLEEAFKAVTDHPLRVIVEFVDPPNGATGAPPGMPGAAGPQAPAQSAQRVPPEVTEAVKKQPIIQELMKRFDASVTQIELLGSGED